MKLGPAPRGNTCHGSLPVKMFRLHNLTGGLRLKDQPVIEKHNIVLSERDTLRLSIQNKRVVREKNRLREIQRATIFPGKVSTGGRINVNVVDGRTGRRRQQTTAEHQHIVHKEL